MQRNMRLLLGCVIVAGMAAQGAEWETDFEKASRAASTAGKYLLLDFSGSDWCGWCIKLENEVFSKPEFKTYAEEKLSLALIDFPRRKSQAAAVKKQNAGLAEKYSVEGFPTIVLLAPDGKTVGRTGYQPGGAAKYVEHLKGMIAEYEKKHPKPAPPAPTVTNPVPAAPAAPVAP